MSGMGARFSLPAPGPPAHVRTKTRQARVHPRPRLQLAAGPRGPHRRGHGRRPPQLLPRHARGARRALHGCGRRREHKKKAVAALQDLCGPKFARAASRRSSTWPTGRRSRWSRATAPTTSTPSRSSTRTSRGDVRLGDRIMFDDGRIVLTVKAIEGLRVRAPSSRAEACAITSGCTCPARPSASRPSRRRTRRTCLRAVDRRRLHRDELRAPRRGPAPDPRICAAWGRPRPSSRRSRRPTPWRTLRASWRPATA